MQVSYEPWLVLLSIGLAIEGAYIGLDLTARIGTGLDTRRRLFLAGAAFSFGAAMWALHFAGMLAAHARFHVDYLLFPMFLSFALCVLVAGIAVYVISAGPFSWARLALSSCLLAAALGVLHYAGMTAESARFVVLSAYGAAGLIIAVTGSGLAFFLTFARAGSPRLFMAASVLGFAMAAAHYIAAAGTMLAPHPIAAEQAPALSPDVLAIVVAVVAFGLSCLFLLRLVPDRAPVETRAPSTEFTVATESNPDEAPVMSSSAGSGGDAELRRGIFAPLGGVGAPPPRLAEHLPVERDGATHLLPVDEVVAVQANAHYTFLFDGSAKLFCPLAIGEVESRLDRGRFLRVHRSHIVNIERVIGCRRSGDSEIVELAADEPYVVPVSRSRAGWLKSRIGKKSGASKLAIPPVSDQAT